MSSDIDYRIFPQRKLVWFRARGPVAFDDLIAAILAVNQDDNFRKDFNTLADLEDAQVTFEVAGFSHYQDLFNVLQKDRQGCRWAIYTRNPETFKNAVTAHLLESRTIKVKVFKERRQALAFLGIDDPAAWRPNGAAEPAPKP
jgi:hypothetical protein